MVGIKFDWLKILPPEGSYSYVGSVFVDVSKQTAKTARSTATTSTFAQGSLVNAMKTTVQTRLNTGDQVQIIGKDDEYLKIKPPAGAYLYINKQFVTITRPVVAAAPPAAPAPAQSMAAPTHQSPAPSAKPTVTSIAAGAILTSTPTTAPSPVALAAPTTHPSPVAAAPTTRPVVAALPPPSPEELFTDYETAFTEISKQPLDSQPIADLMSEYRSLAKTSLSDDLKHVVDIRIATLKARQDNKAKLVEIQQLQKQAADRQLALQAERQQMAEKLKENPFSIRGRRTTATVQPATGRRHALSARGPGHRTYGNLHPHQ